MINLKKVAILGALVVAMGATSVTAFASSKYNTPAEVVAGLTGKTVESVTAEKKETGKTYGTIANEGGKLTEFKAEILEMKKDVIEEKVAAGTMTQDEATEIITEIEENQVNCDGTRSGRTGEKKGLGFGRMMGQGKGQRGSGNGEGNCQGSCKGL